jgi:hypothetical protein
MEIIYSGEFEIVLTEDDGVNRGGRCRDKRGKYKSIRKIPK